MAHVEDVSAIVVVNSVGYQPAVLAGKPIAQSLRWAEPWPSEMVLGQILKMGDKYLRRLLVVGMTPLIWRAKYKPEAVDPWLTDLLSREPARLVTARSPRRGAGGLGDHGARWRIS